MASRYFERGWIFKCTVPKANLTSATPPPSFVLHGEHYVVVLHDSDFPDIDQRSALVVPITSAEAEVQKAQQEGRSVLSSYVEVLKSDYPFLDHDSYVSTSQIMPVNRDWLFDFKDQIQVDKMYEIDFQVIANIGLMETVTRMAEVLYEDRFKREAAAGDVNLNGK